MKAVSCICGGIFDLAEKEKRLKELEARMASEGFWDDHDKGQESIRESNALKLWLEPAQNLKRRFDDVQALLPEAASTGDSHFVRELEEELEKIDQELSELEIRKMLSGELDNKNCYLSINSGAGGTESCDWVEMLARMYQRWAAKRKWQVEVIDRLEGDVAGIKSITMKFSGPFAFGYAKAEKGVHD